MAAMEALTDREQADLRAQAQRLAAFAQLRALVGQWREELAMQERANRAFKRFLLLGAAILVAGLLLYVSQLLLTAGLIREIPPAASYTAPAFSATRAWEEAWWRVLRRELQPICDRPGAAPTGRYRFFFRVDSFGRIVRIGLAEASDARIARRIVLTIASLRLPALTPFNAAERDAKMNIDLRGNLELREGQCTVQRW